MQFRVFFSTFISANKVFVVLLLFFNKSNSTEHDLTVAHNVDRICQKSSKGDKGIWHFLMWGLC